jgi:plastocyanin
MASIDKAAIAFSIAIVAVGVGFAFYAGNVQDTTPAVSSPVVSKTVEPKTQTDPFADIADKVKAAPVEEKPVEKAPVEEKPVMSGPKTVSVNIPSGTSTPGCEESDMCFDPATVTINVGDTVEWKNTDTAAHTVTGGSPADGPSGVFDSSLVMGGASFAHTFDKAGSYDYFCMVHPWMVGNVSVN